MQIDRAADYFQTIAGRNDPQLAQVVGSWQIEIDGAGTWVIHVDHGALEVTTGPDARRTVRMRMPEDEFLALVRGDRHENLMTALLRGAIRELTGNLAFANQLHAIMPAT
jgi:hypothetical protein